MINQHDSDTVVFGGNEHNYRCAARSRADAYAAWIHRIQKKGYTINALLRGEENGELTLVDHGGPFRDYFESGKGKERHKNCMLSRISELTEEEIRRWSKPCSEEVEDRFVWMTSDRKFSFCARLTRSDYNGEIRVFLNISQQKEVEKNQMFQCLITNAVEHDLVHDPWFPDYPDLHGIMLGELRVNTCDDISPKNLLQFTDDRIKEMTEIFFSDEKILSASGRRPAPNRQTSSFKEMLQCMRSMNRTKNIRGGYEICRPGEFTYGYEREVSCYDGGNCGTDIESNGICFEFFKEERSSWEDLIRESEKAYENHTTEETLTLWRNLWGCSGMTVSSEKTKICVLSRSLYLLDPFGLRGIFCFRVS